MALLHGANSLTPRGGTPARLGWTLVALFRGDMVGEGEGERVGEGGLLVIAIAGDARGAGAADDDVGA